MYKKISDSQIMIINVICDFNLFLKQSKKRGAVLLFHLFTAHNPTKRNLIRIIRQKAGDHRFSKKATLKMIQQFEQDYCNKT